MLESFQTKKDHSLTFLHGEAATSSMESAGLAYQAPSLLSAGGAAKDVALLSTATNLIFALLLVKLPSLIKSGDTLKKATVILAMISVVAWLPLILVPLFVPSVSAMVLIPLWVMSLIPALLVGPVRDKWMADLLADQPHGTLLRAAPDRICRLVFDHVLFDGISYGFFQSGNESHIRDYLRDCLFGQPG